MINLYREYGCTLMPRLFWRHCRKLTHSHPPPHATGMFGHTGSSKQRTGYEDVHMEGPGPATPPRPSNTAPALIQEPSYIDSNAVNIPTEQRRQRLATMMDRPKDARTASSQFSQPLSKAGRPGSLSPAFGVQPTQLTPQQSHQQDQQATYLEFAQH